jgi:hypothetical protein
MNFDRIAPFYRAMEAGLPPIGVFSKRNGGGVMFD